MYKNKLRVTYRSMMRRCYDSNNKDYYRYGGKGIIVEDYFHNFYNFETWFKEKFGFDALPKGLSMDRIDNSGNYSRNNIKLSTSKEQNNNRSNNKIVTFNNKTLTISQWSEETGIPRKTLEKRFSKYKYSIEKALTTPHIILYEFNGDKKTLKEWAKEFNISYVAIWYRVKNGWSWEDIKNIPPKKSNH